METKVVEFRTSNEFRRRHREWKTLDIVIRMYCEARHGSAEPCDECSALSEYARRRLERCVFGDEKPGRRPSPRLPEKPKA